MAAIYSQAEADTLRAAIVSGVRVVKYDGPPAREVEYHSLKDMQALLAVMLADLAGVAGTRRSVRFATHKKGFYPGSDT